MKIVHLLGWYFPDSVGGTEVYVEGLCRRLRAAGHDVLIAAPDSHRVARIRCRNEHVMPRGAQAPAEPLDVHLGAADAVGKVPAEQVDDFHARAAMCSKTLAQAVTTSSQSASVNAAEIGRRTSEAATRSVTGSSTCAMSRDCAAYGAECSGT